MDANRWKKLEDLFIAALELAPAERSVFLSEACGDDLELRQELDSMLSVDEESIALAIEGRLLAEDEQDTDRTSNLAGTHIGPYRLEKLIGEGGMGEVYLAQRDDDQYTQKVALKLVRAGYKSSHMLARFRMERQVLARLTHPNITQLLDGGIDTAGRPYLVMQYVEGIPITKFCDKYALSINERLELFRTVCSAVQHAHRNLIVHRDIKPSNILVTEEGEVKLLDFGIAKLLDPDWAMSMAVTQSQIRLMTPEYAAPEQVKGEVITTATDVYALGVLLYEILSGRRPYQLTNRMQAEIERIVCNVAPARPSTAITEVSVQESHNRTQATPEIISRARRTGVSRLKRMLQGDLDNIVLMALRKEPDRRYTSAEQFSQDIERYLTGLPVAAEKDRFSYRFKKLVLRNRALATVVTAALLLIVSFSVVMAIQAQRLEAERDRAQLEATKAQQVAGFLEGLFKASNPFETNASRSDSIQVRDLLAAGVQNIETELGDQPEVQAALLNVLGTVHLDLGDLQTAQPLLEKALDLRRQLHAGDHLEIAESMAEIAALHKTKGDFAIAEPLMEAVLVMQRKLSGNENNEVATSLQRLGALRQEQGNYDEAELLYREALSIRKQLMGENHLDVIAELSNLGGILYLKGQYEPADSIYKEVNAARRTLLGPDHPDLAGSLSNHAGVLHRKGDLEGAEALHREALQIRIKTLDPIHPHIAAGLNNLAANLKAQQKYDEAEVLYKESLEMYHALFGKEHPDIATGMHNLAALLKAKEDYELAIPLYESALSMRKKLLGEIHPSMAATHNNLGTLFKSQKNYKAAEPHLRKALAINRQLLDADHPRIGLTLDTLGDLLYRLGKREEAEENFVEALDILTKKLGPDHRYTVRTKKYLEAVRRK
ncbi:MAG: tetratricopeptide repeat protein [Rhodothermales bacterium]